MLVGCTLRRCLSILIDLRAASVALKPWGWQIWRGMWSDGGHRGAWQYSTSDDRFPKQLRSSWMEMSFALSSTSPAFLMARLRTCRFVPGDVS